MISECLRVWIKFDLKNYKNMWTQLKICIEIRCNTASNYYPEYLIEM